MSVPLGRTDTWLHRQSGGAWRTRGEAPGTSSRGVGLRSCQVPAQTSKCLQIRERHRQMHGRRLQPLSQYGCRT